MIQFDGPLVYQGAVGRAERAHRRRASGRWSTSGSTARPPTQADWLIGKEILAEGVTGKALRSMKEPGTAYDDDVLGKDPQPAHMDDYVETCDDNGGVHINSGIPNRAFYEIATALGGNSWEHAGRILYATLGNPQLRETTDFRRFARLNRRGRRHALRARQRERDAVVAGWEAVGVSL